MRLRAESGGQRAKSKAVSSPLSALRSPLVTRYTRGMSENVGEAQRFVCVDENLYELRRLPDRPDGFARFEFRRVRQSRGKLAREFLNPAPRDYCVTSASLGRP